MPLDLKAFGRRLREARKAAELTQEQLAAFVDLGKQSVSHWEKGRNAPELHVLVVVAKEIGKSLDWLVLGIGTDGLSRDAQELAREFDALDQESRARFQAALTLARPRRTPTTNV